MARDVKKRGKPAYTNRRNRQKYLKKKDNKKKLSKSAVPIIKYTWDETKTPRENVRDMGIAFNPNDAVPIAEHRKEIIDAEPIDGVSIVVPKPEKKVTGRKKNEKQAAHIISNLEQQVKEEEEARAGQDRKFRLFHRETELCVYMLARHGEDFQAMTRDPKNLWQYTPKQWAKKIRTHKESEMCKFLETA
ncbi:Nucleolar protein 16 [Caenorhabditis elegans]|uniref:Nucleolar protein 16 n=1 Tax=Caenorhabditis elegans TaxID=6239 RepID=NOP16_CAEEL|nr:Nucleolar protein 16 [Caenorhabditis elegans]Q94402.1 RecName: Full=Nucleolar protein 16 [Caenorhabditis elegans]CAB03516.1 Nucleolar protein 16 [Caenorhabditis elegans]|eukprot:NP_492248.1 Nucleolar protein 16 [Caenorhabditis elegans]